MQDTSDMLEECVECLRASNCPFTTWEREFIMEMIEQSSWSKKQADKIQKIWDKI